MPPWLRRLRDFEPRRLRGGRAAHDLLRALDEVEPFREAVVEVLSLRLAELKEAVESRGVDAIDEWITRGCDASQLAALALTLEPRVSGYLLGRVAAASSAARAAGREEDAERAIRVIERQADARTARASKDAEVAEAARVDAETRADRAQAEVKRLRAQADVLAESVRKDAQAEFTALRSARDQAETARAALARRVADLEAERDGIARRLQIAERGERAPEQGPSLEAVARIAGTVEDAARALRALVPVPPPRRPRVTSRRAAVSRPPAIPAGLHPDSPDGLAAMLGRGVLVLVDGYNVTHHEEGPGDRDVLVSSLQALIRRTGAACRVYFDGQEPGRRREGAVEVVFTASHEEADDVILDDLRALAADRATVVVSSDKRVADGARERGAEIVSSGALIRLLARR